MNPSALLLLLLHITKQTIQTFDNVVLRFPNSVTRWNSSEEYFVLYIDKVLSFWFMFFKDRGRPLEFRKISNTYAAALTDI